MGDTHDHGGYPAPESIGDEAARFPQEGFQPARWRTVAVAAPVDAVREAISRALQHAGLPGISVKGLPSREGYVLVFTIHRRRFGVEVECLGWEGGTRIQVCVPQEQHPTANDFARVLGWLELALAASNCRTVKAETSETGCDSK